MVSTLKRALPAVAATAALAFAPSALAATVSSGNPLTVNGDAATAQDWAFDDNAGEGPLDAYFYSDPVDYTDSGLPSNCSDWDNGDTNADTYAQDVTNDTSGDGVAYILRCDSVTSVIANASDAGSIIDATSGSPYGVALTHGPGLSNTPIAMNGGAGGDQLFGGAKADTLVGGDGDDALAGEAGNDSLDLGSGDDEGVGGPGNDSISAGDGNDHWVAGGPGDDTIDGGTGNDYLAGDCDGGCGQGTDGNDTITAGDGFDYVTGDGGNDNIDAGAGDDYVYGADGDDVVHGGAGDDGLSQANTCDGGSCYSNGLYGGNGNDKIYGDDGNDTADGGDGDDEIHGGAGDDGVKGTDTTVIIIPFLGGPFSSQVGLKGGDGNDTIYGDDGIDVITGDWGADTIDGGGQSDYIYESYDEDGPDYGKNDTVTGGAGVDSLKYTDCEDGGDYAAGFTLDGLANDGMAPTDPANLGDGQNNYDVENVDLQDEFGIIPIFYCSGNAPAKMVGDANANVLSGGHGDDNIDGGAGPDRLEGRAGNDTFQARDGYPDYVSCGDGVDSVVADQFDTLESCENADVAQVRSAYDKDEPPVLPAPVVFPVVGTVGDHVGPKTRVTTDTTLTLEQMLNGVKLGVTCEDEPCTIEGRLLSRELVGSNANSSALRGFNTVLGRNHAGMKQGKRNITVKPCVRKSKKASAACRDRLRAAWKKKKSVTVKVDVTTRDKAGNRTRQTKLIKVSAPKKKANR